MIQKTCWTSHWCLESGATFVVDSHLQRSTISLSSLSLPCESSLSLPHHLTKVPPATATTFVQHVRRAILYADLEPEEWSDTKEITMPMDRSFTTRFKLTVMFRSEEGHASPMHDTELELVQGRRTFTLEHLEEQCD